MKPNISKAGFFNQPLIFILDILIGDETSAYFKKLNIV